MLKGVHGALSCKKELFLASFLGLVNSGSTLGPVHTGTDCSATANSCTGVGIGPLLGWITQSDTIGAYGGINT